MDVQSLVDGLVGSPLGATLLYLLEWELSEEGFGARPLEKPRPVDEVAEYVTAMTKDDLVAAMLAASSSANPWGGLPEDVVQALRAAPTRRPIAEAVSAAHGQFLTAPADREAQVAWGACALRTPLIGDLTSVYECGEFPWAGLRTHTALSSRHDHGIWSAHDWGPGEYTESRFPVRPDARIAEVNSQDEWLELARRHPSYVSPFRIDQDGRHPMLASGHNAWDIRLRSIEPDGTATVELIDGSQTTGVRGLLMPDWTSVATEFDGVHLSWAGLLLAEANVLDAGGGWLAVARFWGSERTVFLSEVFDHPEPVRQVNLQ